MTTATEITGEIPPRKLLVVDDDSENIDLIERAFRDDFQVFRAVDGQEALDVARKIHPDVVITDQRMPNVTGVEFLTVLKQELPETVRVLVTGYTDYGSLVDAVNAAQIHHYVEKPFHTVDLKTVVAALTRTVELERERIELVQRLRAANEKLIQDETHLQKVVDLRTHELAEANRQLKELAVRDGLTGLFNHRYLLEHLQIELARSFRYDREFSVLFLDLDDFKRINDQFGHAVGDEVLCTIARLLEPKNGGLRRSDFVARYGGEEFCLILPETPLAGGVVKAERICQTIVNTDWKKILPKEARITASIGVAAYPQHGKTTDALIEAADVAQYEAKRHGKNQVVTAPLPGSLRDTDNDKCH